MYEVPVASYAHGEASFWMDNSRGILSTSRSTKADFFSIPSSFPPSFFAPPPSPTPAEKKIVMGAEPGSADFFYFSLQCCKTLKM
jgi:hypothetical protein